MDLVVDGVDAVRLAPVGAVFVGEHNVRVAVAVEVAHRKRGSALARQPRELLSQGGPPGSTPVDQDAARGGDVAFLREQHVGESIPIDVRHHDTGGLLRLEDRAVRRVTSSIAISRNRQKRRPKRNRSAYRRSEE